MADGVRTRVKALIGGITLLFSLPVAVVGQNTGDCISSIPVCQGIYHEANSPPGVGNITGEINSSISCLGGGERHGQWYTFSVQTGGRFCFSIIPNNLSNDYDWAVYDLTNADCADIRTNASLEVSCNFSGVSGITGANGTSGVQNEPCLQVQAGQTFALYVSNWSQSPYGYTLDMQVPGSTASIYDGTSPTIASISTGCSRTTITVVFSELIRCSSVQATDFTVTGPGGPYTATAATSTVCSAGGEHTDTFAITFAPPLPGIGPYQLVITGEVEDLCNNFSAAGTSMGFTMQEPLEITLQATPTGCAQANTGVLEATVIGGQAPFIFTLNGTTPQVNNATFSGLGAGTHTISVRDARLCTASASATVTILTNFTSALTVTDATCHGAHNGTATVTTTGAGNGWNYSWRNAANTAVRETSNASSDMLTTGPGDYAVIVQETAAGSDCADTLLFTVAEPTPFVLLDRPADTTICIGGTAMLAATATGGTPPYTLAWSHGHYGPGPHPVSPVVSRSYTLSPHDGNGCPIAPVSVTVHVRDSLRADLLHDMDACNGVPFTLDIGVARGGDGSHTYTWTNSPANGPLVVDTLASDEVICATVRDGCETPPFTTCAAITVLYTPAIEVALDTSLGCRPLEVAFQLRDTTNGATVAWDFGDGAVTDGPAAIAHIYNVSGQFHVRPRITWLNGCVTDTMLLDAVKVIPVPKAAFAHKPERLTIFEPHARFMETAAPNEVGYAWDFFAFGTSDEPDPEVTFPNHAGALYPVQLVVWNALGCADTLLRLIHVHDMLLIHVPNAFTPNGDGLNELFLVEGNDLSDDEFELHIFDRWGRIIFSSDTPAKGWNGEFPGGGPAEAGVYNWRLKARSIQTLEKHILYGHVTLVR